AKEPQHRLPIQLFVVGLIAKVLQAIVTSHLASVVWRGLADVNRSGNHFIPSSFAFFNKTRPAGSAVVKNELYLGGWVGSLVEPTSGNANIRCVKFKDAAHAFLEGEHQ